MRNYIMCEIIGLERYNIRVDGRKAIILHQTAYARYIVRQFQDRHNGGRTLRTAQAPGFAKEQKGFEYSDGITEEVGFKVPAFIPALQHEAREWGGKLLWLARGCRIDLCVGTRKVLERVTKWTRMEDYILWREMCYLSTFPNIGLLYTCDTREIEVMVINQRTDADLASDTCSAKSCSGFHSGLKGPVVTNMITDWASRRAGATSRNTPDAETVSTDEATFTSGMVQQTIYETLMGRPLRLISETDNETSVAIIKKGYSRKLSYLRRHQRTSISALHEVFFGDGDNEELDPTDARCLNRLVHRPGSKMTADILTKLLEAPLHWRHMEAMGYILVPPEAEKIGR
jgi:hypothetical protein